MSCIYQHQTRSGWLNRLRLHYHVWMFIMQLGQPQPEFSNHCLTMVYERLTLNQYDLTQQFNIIQKLTAH